MHKVFFYNAPVNSKPLPGGFDPIFEKSSIKLILVLLQSNLGGDLTTPCAPWVGNLTFLLGESWGI